MRILVVDDHKLLAGLLKDRIQELALKITGGLSETISVSTLEEGIEEINGGTIPNLVFLDLNLNSKYMGVATLAKFTENNPNKVPVVILTGLDVNIYENIRILKKCMEVPDAVIHGILIKSSDVEKVFIGIERILNEEIWIPRDIMQALVRAKTSNSKSLEDILTPAQRRIANELLKGATNKEIAKNLSLSPDHVAQTTSAIFHKLEVPNRTKAAIVMKEMLAKSGQTSVLG